MYAMKIVHKYTVFILMTIVCSLCSVITAETQSSNTQAIPSYRATTLSEQRLAKILAQQNALIEELTVDPKKYSTNERDRRLEEILELYNTYLLDNPDDVNAYILYGKYLRQIGQEVHANVMFLQANKRNPNIAVVKQQIGNYLAEQGDYALAMPYFLSAIELDPNEMIYHYQLGELLANYKEEYIRDHLISPEAFDSQMLQAFTQAVQLEPDNRDLKIRLAEAYYDLNTPKWEEALSHWESLENTSQSPLDLQIMHLHAARVLMQMNHLKEAESRLNQVYSPALEKNRRELLKEISEKQN
ncbi:MAG: hypothetical protein COZ46_01425 [Verrucomicrobia bacterium CG_4_10_14_3_um_filter_43_23]|nr:MAG: hypothetical protein AUJ82_01455 [Verrucomicrobia bacterium CG1_02_43_26]PIP59560.1 MAG: hypothetical protein COX01_03030 [Verrucomicrobia bacterium CG22_combo_CG10-13_8_21_14_all_43_17]PIX58860.1 MAG: hypothetical protein COZ46_01425 [Verrucomicrobia bacterium CG_4_10_14_3_um_filter_43_23]PIY60955.1 MAG: hypothetical protein COY94_08105 [Verrucomicrobia bacterium CG_4_10_14_0_8_um_filter_43_34]PJA44870.1 MAG: hypothetical protein CO175_00915 [Verrucomicrobia bacterium CG_4_9_14_3_um_fi